MTDLIILDYQIKIILGVIGIAILGAWQIVKLVKWIKENW